MYAKYRSKVTVRALKSLIGVSRSPKAAELYVIFDLLCPEGKALAQSRELKGLEDLGIGPLMVPVALKNGSVPYGEAFLATGKVDMDPEAIHLGKLMYEWTGGEELRLAAPNPPGPRAWFGPSAVMENTYRFRSIFNGSSEVSSPTVIWMTESSVKMVEGFPSKKAWREMREDLEGSLKARHRIAAPGRPSPGSMGGAQGPAGEGLSPRVAP
jgi:hypothetical protein